MNYQIEMKAIEPVTVATLRYKGLMTEAARYFPVVFKAIKGKSTGAPFFCYYQIDQKTGIGELELCVPTTEIPNGQGVTLKNMPRQNVVCLTHMGPYDTLPLAYKAIHLHIEQNELSVEPPWREVYIKGPGMIFKGNPKNYITEILYPLKAGQEDAGDKN